MTTIERPRVQGTDPYANCPNWCRRDPDDHEGASTIIHAGNVGDLGMELCCEEHAGEPRVPTRIYLPNDLAGGDNEVSPDVADKIARDLHEATYLIKREDGETREQVEARMAAVEAEAATTPTGPCPWWCEYPEGHPFEAGGGVGGYQMRDHLRRFNGWADVFAFESYSDGVLEPMPEPRIDTTGGDPVVEGTAEEAEESAAALLDAAMLLRRIQGEAAALELEQARTALRARIDDLGAGSSRDEVEQAEALGSELLGVFARHGISAHVAENVASLSTDALNAVRAASR